MAKPNWLKNRLYLANVTMPDWVVPSSAEKDRDHESGDQNITEDSGLDLFLCWAYAADAVSAKGRHVANRPWFTWRLATAQLSAPADQRIATAYERRQSVSRRICATIPLAVLRARGGLAPELNLIYSAQRGDSAYGSGWQLSFMSNIERRATGGGTPDMYGMLDDPSAVFEFRIDGALLVPNPAGDGTYRAEHDALRSTSPWFIGR